MNAALAAAWISPSSSRSAYVGQHGQLRLRVAERHLLALERDALGEHAVLELVLALDERGRDEPALAGLAQPVEQLALVALGAVLGLAQRLELLDAEEVGVALDDLRLLGGLLLAHAHRAAFLGALEEIPREAALELGGGADRGDAQGADKLTARQPSARRPRGPSARTACAITSVARSRVAVGVVGAAQQDDREARAAQLVEQLARVLRPEQQVEQDERRAARAATAARASATRRRLLDAEAVELEVDAADEAKRRIVLDHEDQRPAGGHGAAIVNDPKPALVAGRAAV